MAERHSHTVPGGRGHWMTQDLWSAAAGLPVVKVAIADIPEFDQDCWFHGRGPTLRMVAEHFRRIQAADLAWPVIFSSDGRLMDGGHRIAKAWLQGRTEVDAVRFVQDPAPDYVEPAG